MDDRRALMASIIANPADDAPRLVYSDWLEEHGDEHDQARAEFIRLRIAAAPLPEKDKQHKKLERLAEKILKRHRETWVAPLVQLEGRAYFETTGYHAAEWSRGLLSELWMPTQTFLLKSVQRALPDLFAHLGVETIQFTSANTKRITAITDSPALSWVAGIIWPDGDDKSVTAFAQSPTCTHLSSLELEDSRATDAGLRAFAATTNMSRLRRFGLPLGRVWQPKRKYTAAGVAAILESSRLPMLDTLDLAGLQQEKFGYPTLFASPHLKRLVKLTVGGNVPMAQLAACPHLTVLRDLTIESATVTDNDIAVLLANRAFARLEKLTFWGVNDGVAPLSRRTAKKLSDRFGKNV